MESTMMSVLTYILHHSVGSGQTKPFRGVHGNDDSTWYTTKSVQVHYGPELKLQSTKIMKGIAKSGDCGPQQV